ncbi:MAG: hypothetical protein KDA70_14890 [Planctomycetaceae bacterium]|nr:hypothetical protein [Planctomycetaceae bacterium]
MISHFSKTRTVIYWSVLLYSVLFLPYCHWEIESYTGGCMDGNLLALVVFCYYTTLFISAVGLIDTIALFSRSAWDRISPSFFFRAFPINFALLVLMWFFLLVSPF